MSQVLPPREEMNPRMRWIQLLAGPVIWTAHFLLSYLLVEAFCNMGWNFTVLGISGILFLLILITIVSVIGTSLFTIMSYRGWKKMNKDRDLKDEFRDTSRWSEGPDEFMYFSGFLLSVLFTATIVMVGLPAFFLRPCS